MAKTMDPGAPALLKYQEVRYFPFGAEPGQSVVLAADPWSFLQAWLAQQMKDRKGANRRRLERARYYADLADAFYGASRKVALPAGGTLAYYGMLNLAKCFISVRGTELETTWEHHGLSLPLKTARTVEVRGPGVSGQNIFGEFARHLGTPVLERLEVSLAEACSHIPEIHEIAFVLGHLPNRRRKYLPIQVRLLVNESKNGLFSEIEYEKKNEERLKCERFYRSARAKYFRESRTERDRIIHRSKGRRVLRSGNWPRLYRNICRDYEGFNIASLLTRQGYRYYCDLEPGAYHHLCYSLMAMFYIGTITRYRPTETESLMDSDFRPLVAEMVASCPTQFLYQVVSHTTRHVCVVPYAKLD